MLNTGKSFVIGNAALPDWPIIYCNESFIALFGWTRSDVIGQPVTCPFLYGQDTDKEIIENFRIGIQEREEYECETILCDRRGTSKEEEAETHDYIHLLSLEHDQCFQT